MDRWSVAQDHAEKRIIDLQCAFVFDEPKLLELVHEKVHPRPCCTYHLGQHGLRNLGKRERLVRSAIAGEQQQSTRQSFLAGVKELIDQILLGAEVSSNHVGDEPVRKLMLRVEDAKHFAFLNDERTALSHRRGRADPQRLAGQAAFAQKITCPEKGNDRLFASSRGYGKLYAALLNVENMGGGITLGKQPLLLAEFDLSL